jgi:N-methylhydantoinase A
VGSALGFFTAPRAFDLIRSHKVALTAADFDAIETMFKEMETEAARTLRASGAEEEIRFERSLDARFVGQGSETHIRIPDTHLGLDSKEEIRRRFDETYERLYGRTYPDSPVELINFKVRAALPERPLRFPRIEKKVDSLQGAVKGRRPAYSAMAGEFIPFTVYDRYRLYPGAVFSGPAIIEERESTVVAGEDARVSVDEYGFLWMELGKAEGGR